jgi:hypothetical protein
MSYAQSDDTVHVLCTKYASFHEATASLGGGLGMVRVRVKIER